MVRYVPPLPIEAINMRTRSFNFGETMFFAALLLIATSFLSWVLTAVPDVPLTQAKMHLLWFLQVGMFCTVAGSWIGLCINGQWRPTKKNP